MREPTGPLGNLGTAACLGFKYIVIRGLGLHVAPALGNFDVSELPGGKTAGEACGKQAQSNLQGKGKARKSLGKASGNETGYNGIQRDIWETQPV